MTLRLETARLVLRPFQPDDAARVYALLSDSRVTDTLLDIDQPFTPVQAEDWIQRGAAGLLKGDYFPLAITRREDSLLIGCIDLELNPERWRADMAYWLGFDYWRQAYTSEAAVCMTRFGFETLRVRRIKAQCLARNIGSARVMEKAGLRFEGRLRGDAHKNGIYEDVLVYGLLYEDWLNGTAGK